MATNKNPFVKNKNEIIYNIINSLIAGGLVLAGSFSDGTISFAGVFAAFTASLVVCITKFKDYWESEKSEYSTKLLNFI